MQLAGRQAPKANRASLARPRGLRGERNVFLASLPSFSPFIPREARPKASRSGIYNFVPQRAQAG